MLLLAALVVPASLAQAQIDPTWDHYKVYHVDPHVPFSTQVTLRDQFQTTTHSTKILDWFANPVEKRHGAAIFPIHRPELHYSWWELDPQLPFSQDLIAINQFGEQFIKLDRSVYLLNPANKNAAPGTPLPVANHYKCYACIGEKVDAQVFLIDQFFGRPAIVAEPRFFCTPVEKRTADGLVHPIVDPNQHYVVYNIDPSNTTWTATFADQFIPFAQIVLDQDQLLMVPTEKVIPTEAGPTTWGRLKSQYR